MRLLSIISEHRESKKISIWRRLRPILVAQIEKLRLRRPSTTLSPLLCTESSLLQPYIMMTSLPLDIPLNLQEL